MAKSPVGGSRAMLKGRIGSDVYSVGKDGKGRRQQVVRSLAEQVSNPRTTSQMFGRMIMSTVMQAAKALNPIIDHSFDGSPIGQPSISKFISTNYALAAADAKAHPANANVFGLVKYQEKGVRVGNYQISQGTLSKSAKLRIVGDMLMVDLTADAHTVGDLKKAVGLSADGYFTGVYIGKAAGAVYCRAKISTALANSTEISAENVDQLFEVESNAAVTFTFYQNNVTINVGSVSENTSQGIIVSDKVAGVWKHNTCVLSGNGFYDYPADTALPTYPTGAEQFLNGGDL